MLVEILTGEEFEFNGETYLEVYLSYNEEINRLFGADILKIRDFEGKLIGYKFMGSWYSSIDPIIKIIYKNLKISFITS